MDVVVAVGVGGAIGAILRWLVGVVINNISAPSFWTPLIVNLIGSFLIGMLLMWFQGKLSVGPTLRAGIVIGLLGGFTTYSAFSMETVNMFMTGAYARAAGYVISMVVVCLLGTWIGVVLGRSV